LSLDYVTYVTSRTIFVRHRSDIGICHAFTENNRADDVTPPSCFYFMEMAEEGDGDDKNDFDVTGATVI